MTIIQHDITMDELMPIISCNYQIFLKLFFKIIR